MDRDFIIGMVLIFLILFTWQFIGPKKPDPAEEAATADGSAADDDATPTPDVIGAVASSAQTSSTPPAAAAATPGATPEAGVNAAANPNAEPAAPVAPAPAALPPFDVATEKVTASFTNVGGRLASWRLNRFNDKAGPQGQPLDLVQTADRGFLPLSTYWVGSGPSMGERDTYEIVKKGPDEVVFTRVDPAGFRVTKTYKPDFDRYHIDLIIAVESLGAASGQGRLSMSMFQDYLEQKSSFFKQNMNIRQFAAYVGGELETQMVAKAAGMQFPANVIWAGWEDVYFLTAVAPATSESTQAQVLGPKESGGPLAAVITLPETTIGPGQSASFEFAAYLGPKSEDVLVAAGHGFDQALDFGWFSGIAKLLVRFLQFLYSVTGNWGVAIIITTVIIKIVLMPLTHKSYKSMKQMSALQPLMAELREKYKEDRERLNQETMALYKAHGVNPASGCLPMLLQLPIFLAFYRALYGTIELRHSPFVWWIQDLSAPDPYYVTPIIMGATMVITQKMTPTSADPVQQKIMMVMPVVFTFMFLNFPSGLVVYWLVNNILTIGQQYYMMKSGPSAPPVAAKPAKG